jgi:hypothetical protein
VRLDNFARADTSSAIGTPSDGGSAWSQLAGTWGIASNTAYESSGAASESIVVVESSAADVTVQVKISTFGNDAGIVIRASDVNNYLVVRINGSTVDLYRVQSGSATLIGNLGGAVAASGDMWTVRASGSTISVYRNLAQLGSDQTSSFNSTATKHGLRSNNHADNRFDYFSIVEVRTWDVGIDFRATSGATTDPIDCTYSLGEQYPQTRSTQGTSQSATFGWNGDYTGSSRDRGGTQDNRLYGIVFDGTAGHYFQLDLPSAGDYVVHIAAGDAAGNNDAKWDLCDTNTVLASLTHTAVGIDSYADAGDTVRTEDGWLGAEATVTLTFSTTIFRLKVPASTSGNNCIAHLRLAQLPAVAQATPELHGQRLMMQQLLAQ